MHSKLNLSSMFTRMLAANSVPLGQMINSSQNTPTRPKIEVTIPVPGGD